MSANYRIFLLILTFSLSTIICQSQTTYYIDQVAGNDANNGTSISTPWKNLSKTNTLTLTAGSKILLKAGSVWNGQQLKFSGSGTTASPIIVDSYGTGSNPLLNGNGLIGQGVVYLYNQQNIEISNLEITNSPNGAVDSIFFVGVTDTSAINKNPLGADRRGVMIAIDNYGTANHIYLKKLNIHHVKGQLGSGSNTINGAVPKRTGGIFFTVLGVTETTSKNSRFNDILIDSCNINYCENNGLALDNEWNVYYPGSTEYTNWYNRRFSNVKISNNVIHHIGKNAMIIRCTDSTGLVEKNVCYETALGTTGNTMFTARAKGTIFQYNEGYYNRATTQTVDPGNIDGSMYDPDYGSVGIIFQYSYSHDNSEGIYWGCNTRSLSNNTSGIPDPGDTACTLRYCISQNDLGDLIFLNYSSAGNEIYNNVFYIKSGISPNIIHENSGNNHTYDFYNNIIYNLSSASSGADFAFGTGTGVQTRNISNNTFYGNHHSTEPADPFKLISNPNFVSPGSATIGISTTNGYRLNYGSPSINSGALISGNGGLDFYGNSVSSLSTPNRGCYQGLGIGAPSNTIPVIKSFTPTTALSGATITIRGSSFLSATSLKIGGTFPTSFTVVNDTTITAIIGNGSTGYIIVANPYGSDTSSSIFNFCVPPAAPTASGVSICRGATATLTASGSGSLSWFNASTGGTRLFNGATYTTPSLAANTTYYVQDSTCTVSSTRTAVTVTIYASTNTATTVSSCSSYTWSRNSITYTSSGTYTYSYTNGSGCASVDTLKLTIKQTSSSTTTVSSCVSYLWNGVTYTSSGAYTKTGFTNVAGCDSIAYLNLTIKQGSTSTTNLSSCVSYLWNGVTYTSSGAYTKSGLINAAGCDSTAYLNLTIKQPTNSTTTISSCVSYLWNGVTYTSSGNYTKTGLINAAGCDSTAYLNLTIKQRSTSTTTVSSCVSYLWNGVTYTSSGSYTKTGLVNIAGCDSTAYLSLTIKQPTSSVTSISNCVSYLWNGVTYTTSGSYTKSGLFNAAGCDSTAVLNLTIKQKSSSTTTVSNCVNYLWNGVTYTASGTYTKTGLINTAGCDSTAYLLLTIKQPTTSTTTVTVETINLPYIWNGVSYTSSGVYSKKLTNSVGCDSTANLNLTVNPYTSNTIINLKLYLEGFYINNGLMQTTLYDLGLSTIVDATDSITVNLWQTNHLSNNLPDYTVKGLLHSNGSISLSFPSATYGNSYYIAVKYKNALETWSALSITIGAINNYDFTTGINKAFSDGINLPMKNMGNSKYAFLTGDLNNDGAIDISDMQPIQNHANQFYFGYYSTDCTGDGGVDISDLQIVQNNSSFFLFYARPY